MALTKALSHQVLVRAAGVIASRSSVFASIDWHIGPGVNPVATAAWRLCGGCLVGSGLIPRSRASRFVRYVALWDLNAMLRGAVCVRNCGRIT